MTQRTDRQPSQRTSSSEGPPARAARVHDRPRQDEDSRARGYYGSGGSYGYGGAFEHGGQAGAPAGTPDAGEPGYESEEFYEATGGFGYDTAAHDRHGLGQPGLEDPPGTRAAGGAYDGRGPARAPGGVRAEPRARARAGTPHSAVDSGSEAQREEPQAASPRISPRRP